MKAYSLKYRNGLSLTQIGTKLGITSPQVVHSIQAFEKNVLPFLPDTTAETSRSKSLAYQRDRLANQHSTNEQRSVQGYTFGRVPFGYLKDPDNPGIPKQDPVAAAKLRDWFERVLSAESTSSIARTAGIEQSILQHFLKNPYYKGMTRYREQFYRGKHQPIISETRFDRVQQILQRPADRDRRPRSPFGFYHVRGELKATLDPNKRETIQRVHWLHCERKNRKQIAKELGLGEHLVYRILTMPIYRQIVGESLWEKSSKTRAPSWKEQQGQEVRKRIVEALKEQQGRTVELAKRLGISLQESSKWLNKLKGEAVIKKQAGLHGNWYLPR